MEGELVQGEIYRAGVGGRGRSGNQGICTDPSKALVFLVPADANSDGDLLNGAVYSQGNIGNPNGGVNQRGLAGVNMGRKTIGTQIASAAATNSTDPFD